MHANTSTASALKLGAKLGAIIQDSTAREHLVENSAEVLADLGARSDLTILADTADLVHLIIPADVDAARVAANDESYFEELGKLALGSCYYEDLPE
ncbi:hypothetical protein [Labrenzia sp. VG12]|uniref:hypothetical protein n=1 Tax=Labrenzia sp. VG12 TaxID=2021862 RepID=UPI000B8C2F79|nr:hypothetical protein [Labrenzia sp. VG12]ASP32635.1 hypothetical protein CHH27_04740 [Labrenzia sp. VG12]